MAGKVRIAVQFCDAGGASSVEFIAMQGIYMQSGRNAQNNPVFPLG